MCEVLTAVFVKIDVFWDFSSVHSYNNTDASKGNSHFVTIQQSKNKTLPGPFRTSQTFRKVTSRHIPQDWDNENGELVGWSDRGKPKYSQTGLFQCHFFHLKSHMDWLEHKPPRWQTSYELPEPYNNRYSSPSIDLDRSWGFQEVESPRFSDSRHMKVVMLSALRTGRFYPL